MSYTVDGADLDQLVGLLDDVEGIRSCSDEISKVNTPGVWVQHAGYTLDKLEAGHYRLHANLVLIVSDQDSHRSRLELVDLLNAVLTVVKPAGRIEPRSVVRPDSPAPVPGLLVPVTIHCVPESE